MGTIRHKNIPIPAILIQTEPTCQNSVSDTSSDEDSMQSVKIRSERNFPYSGLMIFKPQEASDFEERKVDMTSGKSVRIGRSSSGNEGPSLTNMIFDCKVMSKSHADIWYDHTGEKFYIKDRSSSNGTYLNKQHEGKILKTGKPYVSKLSRSRREIYHGDTLQLGVCIVEDNGITEMSYACVRGILQLYLPDGTEAIKSSLWEWTDLYAGLSSNSTYHQTLIPHLQDIQILKTTLQEAVYREHRMNEKLGRLTAMLQVSGVQLKKLCKPAIDEILINDYVETLCRERNILEKNTPPESLERTVSQLLREKLACQQMARLTVKDLMTALTANIIELRDTKNEVEQLHEKFALCQSLCAEKSNVVQDLHKENEYLKEKLVSAEYQENENRSPSPVIEFDIQLVSVADQKGENSSLSPVTDFDLEFSDSPINEELFENKDSENIGGNGDSNIELFSDGSPKENTMSQLEIHSYLTEIQQQCNETLDACIAEDVCDQVIKFISRIKANVDKIESACSANATINYKDYKSSEKEAFTGIEDHNYEFPINVADADKTEPEGVLESPGCKLKMATSENVDSAEFPNNSDYQTMQICDQNVFPENRFLMESSVSQDLELEYLLKHFQRNWTNDHPTITVAEGKKSYTKECGIIFTMVIAILIAVWNATLDL